MIICKGILTNYKKAASTYNYRLQTFLEKRTTIEVDLDTKTLSKPCTNNTKMFSCIRHSSGSFCYCFLLCRPVAVLPKNQQRAEKQSNTSVTSLFE